MQSLIADGLRMPFSTVKPLLAEAQDLLDRSGLRSLDEVIDVCCSGLGFLAREGDSYCGSLPFCQGITPHFEKELMELVRTLKVPADTVACLQIRCGDVQGQAFALLEDMALFMREKKLRNGAVTQSAQEERVLSFFESSGHWKPDSGEVVTDTYYKLLPIAVIRDFTEAKTKSRVHH